MMYSARGNQVLIYDEPFISVHPTDSGDVTPEVQAQIISDLFNREYDKAPAPQPATAPESGDRGAALMSLFEGRRYDLASRSDRAKMAAIINQAFAASDHRAAEAMREALCQAKDVAKHMRFMTDASNWDSGHLPDGTRYKGETFQAVMEFAEHLAEMCNELDAALSAEPSQKGTQP